MPPVLILGSEGHAAADPEAGAEERGFQRFAAAGLLPAVQRGENGCGKDGGGDRIADAAA